MSRELAEEVDRRRGVGDVNTERVSALGETGAETSLSGGAGRAERRLGDGVWNRRREHKGHQSTNKNRNQRKVKVKAAIHTNLNKNLSRGGKSSKNCGRQ